MNPSSSAGVAVYRWADLNGDHLPSAEEVLTNQFLGTANGFNAANPTAVTSANRGEAFQACEFLMDYLKTQAPFWKKEQAPGGAAWVEAKATDDQAAERWK